MRRIPARWSRRVRSASHAVVVALGLIGGNAAWGGEARIAVASNFAATCQLLGDAFAAATGHAAMQSAGSSGKLYAQIRQGAPFDVFLSADAERPQRLEAEGDAVAATRMTYAFGRLALWSAEPKLPLGPEFLAEGRYRHLAIANPEIAPYGVAAREVLRGLGLWERLQPRLLFGENIAQAYQFVATGSAELGIVARSQLRAGSGSRWVIPGDRHAPLEQQAVLLSRAADNAAARAFLQFLASPQARAIVVEAGYDVADGGDADSLRIPGN